MTKDLTPKTLAWLERHNPGFKWVRKHCGEPMERAREEVERAMERKEAA